MTQFIRFRVEAECLFADPLLNLCCENKGVESMNKNVVSVALVFVVLFWA